MKYGPIEVIKNITFDILPGEFASIIGKSGCGKTTLLKIIARLLKPTNGEVSLNTGSDPPLNSFKGYVQQEMNLFPHLTVRQNIGFPLGLKSFRHLKSKRIDIINSLLEIMKLSEFADYYPDQLSGGMKQRVVIARALSIHPDVLLLDEPFSFLDEVTREELQDELYRIWLKFRPSIIMTTHSVTEAVYLSEKIIILSDRPAEIKRIVEVNFGSREDLRNSDSYFAKQKEVRKIFIE